MLILLTLLGSFNRLNTTRTRHLLLLDNKWREFNGSPTVSLQLTCFMPPPETEEQQGRNDLPYGMMSPIPYKIVEH
jgi:hypothetical protein